MAVLNIRNLPNQVHTRLRIRAAKAGRSMEAEARTILTVATEPREIKISVDALQHWVDQLYGAEKPTNVVADLIAERRAEAAASAVQE